MIVHIMCSLKKFLKLIHSYARKKNGKVKEKQINRRLHFFLFVHIQQILSMTNYLLGLQEVFFEYPQQLPTQNFKKI